MELNPRGGIVQAWRPSRAVIVILGTLLLLGGRPRAGAQPACVSTASFELAPQGPLPDGLQGKVVLRSKEEKKQAARTLAAHLGAPVSTELPCGSEWEVAVDFPNIWGPRRVVTAGAGGAPSTTALALWPLGRISGAVKLADKRETLPKTVVVQTLSPRVPAHRNSPVGSMDCPVDSTGKWVCPPSPAATFDLAVTAAGFIPQYLWNRTVPAAKVADVGTLTLKKGASVAGWVEVEGGGIEGCRARLSPLVGPGGGPALAERARSTWREVAVRKDGFFQIEGVAPGQYSLEVRQPGYATAAVNPVAVAPRLETFLRNPVVLTRPLDLEVAVSPPLDPLGKRWQLLLFQASGDTGGFDKTIYADVANEQGVVKLPGETPGRYQAIVADSRDNRLAVQTFQVTGPADAAQTIEIKALALRGTVKLGQEPLAATLWFGGKRGKQSIKMVSDPEGQFRGALTKDGWWTVDVGCDDPKFETRARVKVTKDGKGRASAEIELAATRAYGKVVDDAGHAMPGATVAVSADDGTLVHMDTDAAGAFDFRGLPAGLAYASASLSSAQGEWLSDRASLFLKDGEDSGPLEIRLRKEAKLSGVVQSSWGPVSGAGVTVFGMPPYVAGGDSVRTEMDGTFTAHAPAGAEMADVLIAAPGFGLKAYPVVLGAEPSPPLRVEEPSGEVSVLLSAEPKEAATLWIFQNGLFLSKQTLMQWAASHGLEPVTEVGKGRKQLTVPELAPGEYRACLVSPAALIPWQTSGWTAPLARCVNGTLAAGGALRLDLSDQE